MHFQAMPPLVFPTVAHGPGYLDKAKQRIQIYILCLPIPGSVGLSVGSLALALVQTLALPPPSNRGMSGIAACLIAWLETSPWHSPPNRSLHFFTAPFLG